MVSRARGGDVENALSSFELKPGKEEAPRMNKGEKNGNDAENNKGPAGN
jgi:hypothetical protein